MLLISAISLKQKTSYNIKSPIHLLCTILNYFNARKIIKCITANYIEKYMNKHIKYKHYSNNHSSG